MSEHVRTLVALAHLHAMSHLFGTSVCLPALEYWIYSASRQNELQCFNRLPLLSISPLNGLGCVYRWVSRELIDKNNSVFIVLIATSYSGCHSFEKCNNRHRKFIQFECNDRLCAKLIKSMPEVCQTHWANYSVNTFCMQLPPLTIRRCVCSVFFFFFFFYGSRQISAVFCVFNWPFNKPQHDNKMPLLRISIWHLLEMNETKSYQS